MSDVKRWKATERPGAGAVIEVVDASDYDALSQRCHNLESVQHASLARSGRMKSEAGALGWTADSEDGPLDFLIGQAQRCRDMEQKLYSQLCRRVAGAWSGAQQHRELDDCLSRGISAIEQERDQLRAEVEKLRKALRSAIVASGGSAAPEVSSEFLEMAPLEVLAIRVNANRIRERLMQIVTNPHESKEALANRVRQILEECK